MTHLVHTNVDTSGIVEKPPKGQQVRWSTSFTSRSLELGYSVRTPPYRLAVYRGGVAAELPTANISRRRLATPFAPHEIPALNAALAAATAGMEWSPVCNTDVRRVLVSRWAFAQSRAASRGRTFTVTVDGLCALYTRQDGLCAVTGLLLDTGPAPMGDDKWRKPFRVSLDRIDSSKGYEPENVRLVCAAVNNALGAWGEGVFAIIAAAFLCNRRPLSSAVERRVHIADVVGSIPTVATISPGSRLKGEEEE